MTTKTIPSWMQVSAGSVVLALSVATAINGMPVDSITMTAPLVRQEKAAQAQSANDPTRYEPLLFASLCETGEADLGKLEVRDYRRLQAAYTLLTNYDDEDIDDPDWLDVSLARSVIMLSVPATVGDVTVDRLTMVSPTIAQTREIEKAAGGDSSRLESLMFTALCGIQEQELEGLTQRDYRRLRTAYFRLVDEDGV